MRKFAKKTIILYVAILSPTIIPQIILLFGIGFWRTSFDVLLLLNIGICGIGLFINMARLLFKKHRANALQYLGAFLIIGLMIIPNLIIAEKIRLQAFYLAGLRAKPVIIAVENFYKENNKTPETLEELIPTYLEKIPFGIPKLSIGGTDKETGTWSLSADAGTGLLNWDEFIYRSNQDYLDTGVPIKKLGKWGYMYE